MTRWTRSLKKAKIEPTISGAFFYLSNRSRIQVNVSPNDARESVTVLPFRHLPGTSAFKPLPTWCDTGAERIGSE
jgi:hypothetical protein